MTHAPLAPFADAPPRVQKLIVALAVAVTVAGGLGSFLLPSLSVRHPMVLLALAPNYLALVAPRVDFTPAYLLVASRRLLGMCAIYGISGLYGEATLRSLTADSPRVERAVRWVSARFQRFGLAFLIVTPGVAVSMIAGVAGMRLRTFVLGAALGQLISTAVYYRFSMAIGAFTERVLRFMERNLVVVSIVVAVLVAAQHLASRRRAKQPDPPAT
ncbi:MAG: hypothetical protein U0325_20310 [Polyangiales bacterium]